MKPQEYDIITIQDMVDVVTKENKDNFIKDLSLLFDQYLMAQELNKEISELHNTKLIKIKLKKMTWIDDKKNTFETSLEGVNGEKVTYGNYKKNN
jgi:hypothetical protein